MGRIVKKVDASTSKYYWYPGEKDEWVRALVALAMGGAAAALLMLMTRNGLAAVVVGCSATLVVAGFNFGRRDAKALAGFPDLNDKAARRAAVLYSGRAFWRGLVQGLGIAFAAVLVVNAAPEGWTAGWLLPLVPAVLGALGHQTGMVWDRLGTTVKAVRPATTPAAKPATTPAAKAATAKPATAKAATAATAATAGPAAPAATIVPIVPVVPVVPVVPPEAAPAPEGK